jgi:hypothetical protein
MEINKIARILDVKGAYNLADKLDKIAQNIPTNYSGQVYSGDQYFTNPNTPKEIMQIRKQLVPTDFRQEIRNYNDRNLRKNVDRRILDTADTRSFINSLYQFGKMNGMNNLTQTFDSYANAGATFMGQSIKNNPILRSLYLFVSENPRTISPDELHSVLEGMMSGLTFQE